MGYCQHCLLCGKTIDSKCSGSSEKAWRASYQILEFDVDGTSLVEPSNVYLSGREDATHAACWSVLLKIVQPHQVTTRWLQTFRIALGDFRPFLADIPFSVSPGFLDCDVDGDVDGDVDDHLKIFSSDGARPLAMLPNEIVQVIYGYLSSYQDLFNLREATSIEPNGGKWLELGRKYIAGLPYSVSKANEIPKIRQILWNLHSHPSSRFPSSTNYGTVWENVELAVGKLGQRLAGADVDIDTDWSERHVVRATLDDLREVGTKSISFLGSSTVSLNFNHAGGRRYICGFQFDGGSSGYPGDSSVAVSCKRVRGLRLVSDGHGFISLQVRDLTSRNQRWYGSLPGKTTSDLVFSQIEWPTEWDKRLVIMLDSFKICALSDRSGVSCPPIKPSVWYSSLPSSDLTPLVLLDRNPLESVFPFSFVEGDFNKIVAISTFVDVLNQAITGFEFMFRDGTTVCAGRSHPSTSKLSFCVDIKAGETLTGIACAEAKENSGVVVKVFTDRGNCVVFGDQTVDNWHISLFPNGMFCTSKIVPSISMGVGINCISVLGILKNKYNDRTLSVNSPALKEPVTWDRTTVKIDGYHQEIKVFLSKAELASVSRVTVFAKALSGEQCLCGTKIQHLDGSSDILGEAREETRSFPLEDDIISVSVYYTVGLETSYRIQGLRFSCRASSFDVGRVEVINQCFDVSNTLYWWFNHAFSYLSPSATGSSITKIQHNQILEQYKITAIKTAD